MPKGFNAGPKDPFQDLAPEFKDAIDSSDRDQIKARVAGVFRDEAENQRNLREDLHVQESKVAFDKLAAPYKQAKDEAKVGAKIAAKKDDHAGATDAALALVEVEDKESTDNALISAKETLSGAKEQYTDATKMNKLKISYCLKVLKDKGGASRSSTAEIVQSIRTAVPGATMTFSGPDGVQHEIE
jgi:hypothetical protein